MACRVFSGMLYVVKLFSYLTFHQKFSISEKNIIGGNATEKALALSIDSSDRDITYNCNLVERIPFDSSLKFSAAHAKIKKDLYLIKGAPEKLIQSCKYAHLPDGRIIPFSSTM